MRRVLDVKGLYCPEPVLRTERAMRDVPAGEILTVLATDPAAIIDFTYYCHRAGLELLAVAKEPGLFTFEIRKPAAYGLRRENDSA
jgi:tRNA 2-thiouridine synthesizing protein A